jgi:enamine deaminase RidA (YjgF/YER057c/UK114 family)
VPPPGREYSHVAVLTDPRSTLCFISGQVGEDTDGSTAPGLAHQLEHVFANLGNILTAVGSSLPNIVQLTTYLVDKADIDEYVAARTKLFHDLFPDGYPPNTLVVVDALARRSLRVEVQAIAAIPR